MWLAPEQVRILPISEKTNDYAVQVRTKLHDSKLRCEIDLSDEKIGAKVAKAHGEKIPYMLIVGPKEAESGTVSVRIRGCPDSKTETVDAFLATAKGKIADKEVDLEF